jgi:hypothetical protein
MIVLCDAILNKYIKRLFACKAFRVALRLSMGTTGALPGGKVIRA